jgi:AraC-like DNA-binding protein
VALHNGTITLDSYPGRGSAFHLYLPLPNLSGQLAAPLDPTALTQVILISSGAPPPQAIAELSQRLGWTIRQARANDAPDLLLKETQPAMLAWDVSNATPGEWALVQNLRSHPQLCRLPFILYGREQSAHAPPIGVTDVLTKPISGKTLMDTLYALFAPNTVEPVLIVDDDAQARELYARLAAQALPGHPVRQADSGQTALDWLARETPGLVILDLMMPDVDGFTVLERLRADRRTRNVPIVVMSGKVLSLEDIQRLDHARVTFQSKELLSEDEAVVCLRRVFAGAQELPQPTSALVKRALGYLHQNYRRPLTRQEIAQAVGVSESYLSRIFHQEVGLSPTECLTRLRVQAAKELLSGTSASITEIASQVGIDDPAYFSRVFSKYTNHSPQAHRKQTKT